MNKVILTLFALSTALLISPVASAQKYDFSYAGSDFSDSDWLIIGGAPSLGGDYESHGNLARGGSTFFLVANPAAGHQGFGSGDNFQTPEETYTFGFDNLFFLDGDHDADRDIDSLLFRNGYGTEFSKNRGKGKGNFDPIWKLIERWSIRWERGLGDDPGNGGTCGNGDNGGSTPPTHLPEYGGLSMLILSALALAGGFLFKARQPGSADA